VRVAAGTIVFRQGDPATVLYRVVTGRVSLLRYAPRGRAAVLRRVLADDWLGAPDIHEGVYAATARADQPSVLLAVPAHAVLKRLASAPRFARAWGREMATLLSRLARRVDRLRLYRARQRITHYLLTESPGTPGDVVLPYGLAVWADELGVTLETLSRTLSQMRSDGALARSGRRLRLLRGD
jgi:CRP-like cAMP-binding protein